MEWSAMLILGAYHGINPGMGWLFAVALGMQEGRARGVWRALPPIAIGHALAVGTVLVAAAAAGVVIPLHVLKVVIATVLITFGCYRLWRHRHPRFGGMANDACTPLVASTACVTCRSAASAHSM